MNRVAQVRKLIKYAAGNLNFFTRDKQGNCGLHFAVKHNNIELVHILVINYQKYGSTVDVADEDGLTPLLHAQHLGYDDIAQVLVAGGASTQRADDKTLRNAHEWKNAGKLMRSIVECKRKENHQVYGKKLAINVLPQIDPRGLYRTKTTLWNRSNTKHVTIQSPSVYRKSYSLPSNYRTNSIEKLRSILKYRPDEKTLLVPADDVIDDDDEDIELRRLVSPAPLTTRSQPSHNKAVVTSIGQIMALLSDQICDAYRDPAIDKIKQTMIKERGNKRHGNRLTTLTKINNRIKVKSDEQEKKHKLRKELDRQTKILKHKGESSVSVSVSERQGEPAVRDTTRLAAADRASREPSKVGLIK